MIRELILNFKNENYLSKKKDFNTYKIKRLTLFLILVWMTPKAL